MHANHAWADTAPAPLPLALPVQYVPATQSGDPYLAKILGHLVRQINAAAAVFLERPKAGEPRVAAIDGVCTRVDHRTIETVIEVVENLGRRDSAIHRQSVVFRGSPGMLSLCQQRTGDDILVFCAIFLPGQERSGGENLEHYRPLLEGCAALWSHRERTATRSKALKAAIDKTAFGLILLDIDRDIVVANDTAARLLSTQNGLRRIGKSIGGTSLSDSVRLQTAIDYVVSNPGQSQSIVIAISRYQARRPLIIAISAIGSASTRGECAALLHLIDPDRDFTPLLEPVCRHYGLSPVETRLAVHLTLGSSLASAAKVMRLREATARSYLKQIFLKIDIKRQSELVGVLLKSCVPSIL